MPRGIYFLPWSLKTFFRGKLECSFYKYQTCIAYLEHIIGLNAVLCLLLTLRTASSPCSHHPPEKVLGGSHGNRPQRVLCWNMLWGKHTDSPSLYILAKCTLICLKWMSTASLYSTCTEYTHVHHVPHVEHVERCRSDKTAEHGWCQEFTGQWAKRIASLTVILSSSFLCWVVNCLLYLWPLACHRFLSSEFSIVIAPSAACARNYVCKLNVKVYISIVNLLQTYKHNLRLRPH